MRVDRQPPALLEVEDILVVQISVEWTNRLWSGQKLAGGLGRRGKCGMFRRELKEWLEPDLERVQHGRWAAPRHV